jgi:uncharacterized repeat protein (TIGR03803 family)
MKFGKEIFLAAALAGLSLLSARAGVIFSNLVVFGATNGEYAADGLVQAADGNFYGTAYDGGAYGTPGFGTVFRVSPGGLFSNLFSFNGNNGANPYAGLAIGTNGNFYGTTEQGGTNGGFGTVFEITPAGALTPLLSFNNANGANPEAPLVLGADGNFYGTTSAGGTNGGFGTVFRISHGGSFASLFSFNGTNGSTPYGVLAQGTNGNFYGTASAGGTNGGFGAIFEITSAGVLTPLYSFGNTNGANPYAGLVLGADGNFYGTTSAGGATNDGTIFLLTPAGKLTSLFSFHGPDGEDPYGSLIQCADGGFYGTTELGGTNGFGSVFKWSANGGLVPLFSFDRFFYGAWPLAGLVQGTDGAFYGTTDVGAGPGKGTVFRLSAPVAPALKTARVSGGAISFGWTSVAGQTYQVQFNASLGQTNWTNYGSAIPATNGVTSASASISSNPSRCFYRVILLP